jgi:hypothetical protein
MEQVTYMPVSIKGGLILKAVEGEVLIYERVGLSLDTRHLNLARFTDFPRTVITLI